MVITLSVTQNQMCDSKALGGVHSGSDPKGCLQPKSHIGGVLPGVTRSYPGKDFSGRGVALGFVLFEGFMRNAPSAMDLYLALRPLSDLDDGRLIHLICVCLEHLLSVFFVFWLSCNYILRRQCKGQVMSKMSEHVM